MMAGVAAVLPLALLAITPKRILARRAGLLLVIACAV
jgi:hypothetical protein